MNDLLIRFVSACVLALAWVIAWQQILYAGWLPGEGFTASVLTLLVVLLQFVVIGRVEAARRLPPRWFFTGLVAGVALLLGLVAGPLLAGRPMLEVFKWDLGPWTLSSTTLFDVALFLVVAGGLLAAFAHLEEPPA